MSNSPSSSISDEIREAKALLTSVNFITATTAFLVATYERSPYTRVKVTLTFPDDYPSKPLIATIDPNSGGGVTIPPGLKKKIENGLNNLALESAMRDNTQQFNQVRLVLQSLISFINNNLFIPCWKELRACIELMQQLPSSSSSKQSTLCILNESNGTIRLTLHDAAYYYKCIITIDPAYPDYSAATGGKACFLQMQSTNFPIFIENMITSQAQDIVLRIQAGQSYERALLLSNPIKAPKDLELTTDGTNQLILIKPQKEETEQEWKIEENKRLAGYYDVQHDIPLGGTINPQPSLLALVSFLVREVQRLVSHTCPGCKDRVLPGNREEMSLPKLKLKMQPMRTYCGCWYHKSCLNTILTEPPFGLLQCPTVDCGGQRVYHPDWSTDVKQLEKEWAAKQAKLREIEDTMSFF